MSMRWTLATVGALALALLTLPMVREHRGERIASTSARSDKGAPPEGQYFNAERSTLSNSGLRSSPM